MGRLDDTMGTRLFGRSGSAVLFWVGLFGGLASILSFIGGLFVWADWKSVYIAIASSVYIIVLMLICAYIIWDRGDLVTRMTQQRSALVAERDRAKRDARYAEVFAPLHGIYHKLRDTLVGLQRMPPQPGDVYDESFCRAILDVFRDIFQTTTGQRCCTCIKAFDGNEEDLRTICRDSVSEASRGAEDDTRPCRVSGNKDFSVIVAGQRRYFFCSDLVRAEQEGNYYNDNPNWRSRYRSAIVWPIRCRSAQRAEHELFGFLCVDSMARDAFNEDKDVQVGACVADMIYTYFNSIDMVNSGLSGGSAADCPT